MRLYDPETLEKHEAENVVAELAGGMVPSVTSILSIIRHEYLEPWFIRKCVERYEQTGDFVEAVEYRDTTAADFGTTCHALIEAHLTSTVCQVEHDKRHQFHVQPLYKWIDQNVAEVIFTERPFADKSLGYGGTADFLFQLKDGRLLLGDVKVKSNSKHFPMSPELSYQYQLSAYRAFFRKDYGAMDIANFLLASPFGYAKYPTLRVFDYGSNDWIDGFHAARHLWMQQFYSSPWSPITS